MPACVAAPEIVSKHAINCFKNSRSTRFLACIQASSRAFFNDSLSRRENSTALAPNPSQIIPGKTIPHFSNPRKEISKSPKIYSYDMGLMNYITDRLREVGAEAGSLMENYVFTELVKKGLEVKFWRTGTGAEVDFIVNGIPIEVKASVLNNFLLTKSFFSYLETYLPVDSFLLNSNLYGVRDVDGKKVYFYPLWAVSLLIKQRLSCVAEQER